MHSLVCKNIKVLFALLVPLCREGVLCVMTFGLGIYVFNVIPPDCATNTAKMLLFLCQLYNICSGWILFIFGTNGIFRFSMMTSSNENIFRVTGHLCREFTGHWWIPPAQRAVTRSFDVFFDLCLNKQLSIQSWDWWFETPSRSLWHHRNGFRPSRLI